MTAAVLSGEGIVFPEVSFWNREAPQISLINPGDFKKFELLDKLGLRFLPISRSFGTKDRGEILRRQRTVRFLVENRDVRRFLEDTETNRHARFSYNGQEFLDGLWINPETGHNCFFTAIHKFVERLRSVGQLPSEIAELQHFLADTLSGAETLEADLGQEMGNEIEKSAIFHGVAWIRVKGNCKGSHGWSVSTNSDTYGYQRYSYHLSGFCQPAVRPNWMNARIWRWLGVSKLTEVVLHAINRRRKHRRFADLLIVSMPTELEQALLSFAQEKFAQGVEALNEYENAYFQLYFSYEEGELKVRLVTFYSCANSEKLYGSDEDRRQEREKFVRRFAPAISGDYLGYSRRRLRRIAKENESLVDSTVKKARQSDFSMKFFAFIEGNMPNLLTTGMVTTTERLEKRFKWNTVEGLRQSPHFSERCERAERYRHFVTAKIGELREISCVANQLVTKSKEWRLPLCFPVILSNTEHVVSFDKLLPVHLIGRGGENGAIRPRDLVPVSSLASLNGRMIGLTGQNAGGKTVTKEAILAAIYLGQSGLPVFGANVVLNPKSTLGLAFLERGEGSTLELMLRKTGKVLEAVQSSSENSIVVFLDEVGTGTQESAGLELGERILSKFGESGCSIVFSTQITALAEKARDEMGALCYQVNLGHRIRPGIGAGGADRLAEKLGIDKLLS